MTLGDLLAVIHGDGGHHTNEVGIAQSMKDAVEKIHAMREPHSGIRCAYEIRLSKWSYEKSPRTCERLCVLSFFAEVPCFPQQGSEIDGLPGVDAAVVSKCFWSHKDGVLSIRLEDEECESLEEFKAVKQMLIGKGWSDIVETTPSLNRLEDKHSGS